MTGDGLGRGLSDMWRSVLVFIPAALAFAAIVLVGYLVARLLRTAVTKGLRKAGFDRAVERGGAGRVLGSISAGELCGKLAFYAVLLFALQLAFGIWGPNPVSDLLTELIAWLPRAFVAIVIVVLAAAVARAAQDLITGALGGLPYGRLLARVVSVVIVVLGVFAALDQVRIATAVTRPLLIAVLATVAGVLIVGVGGGLIRPMQQRWEVWLDRAGAESAIIREHARAYAGERARRAAETEAAARPVPRGTPASDDGRPYAPVAPTTDETQVIPPPRSGAAAPGGDDDTATVITSEAGDTTIVNPGPNDTVVIGGGTEDTERTQVITPAETTTTRPLPPDTERPATQK